MITKVCYPIQSVLSKFTPEKIKFQLDDKKNQQYLTF